MRFLDVGEEVLEHELANLSRHFEGVEFGIVELRSLRGRSVDRVLFSGRAGEIGSATVPFVDSGRVLRVVHTHPSGSAFASNADRALVRSIGEGFVVLPDGSQFRFTPSNVNTLLPTLKPGQTIQSLLIEMATRR